MRTLQASLDLDDNGDQVISRQFGGESSLRTLKSGHTAIRADQFDSNGWQLPELADLCQNDDQGIATIRVSHRSLAPETQLHERQHTSRGQRRSIHSQSQTTAEDLKDFNRQIFSRHRLGSRVGNK